jgi:hypothetical protein
MAAVDTGLFVIRLATLVAGVLVTAQSVNSTRARALVASRDTPSTAAS